MIDKNKLVKHIETLLSLINEAEEISECETRITNEIEEIPEGIALLKRPTGWRDITLKARIRSKL